MFDSLIAALKDSASRGCISNAFRIFSHIKLHAPVLFASSTDLSVQSLSSLLLSCTNFKCLAQGKQLHAHVISLGLEQHISLAPKLVSFYSAFDLMDDAHVITQNLCILHPIPWNVLISSYVRNGMFEEALLAYRQMLAKGIRPDSFTYPSVLKACGEVLDLTFGRVVHESIEASGVGYDLFVQNALIAMYGKCGEVDAARNLFDMMPERDLVSWNSMLNGYASKGMWTEVFELFEKMQAAGVIFNVITWNIIAGGCLQAGNYEGALKLLCQMRASGVHFDAVALIIGLGACSHFGAPALGEGIHGYAVHSCLNQVENVSNALITMYARCKNLVHAKVIFRCMETKSLISWNSIISGYAYWDQYKEASFLFREMLLSGVEPNYVTIASILPLCTKVLDLQCGKEFHCFITRRECFKDCLLLWNALLDMYVRSGKIEAARRVFDLLSKKDEVTYTSLIAGYGIQREGRAALRLFYEMIKSQIKPDHVAMVAALSACSHSGLVTEGQMLFCQMFSDFGITPYVEHFSCMIDLYGKAGLLMKAKETIMRMPYKPTLAMWVTLINACRIHGNMEIGEWAADKLLEMRPENPGYYLLIADMYAASKCWSKFAKVRSFMQECGVREAHTDASVNYAYGT